MQYNERGIGKAITPLLPKFVGEVVECGREMGITLTLVGGAVRDYLLNNELPSDLDFEIHCPGKKVKQVILDLEETLQSQRQCRVERLPFSILRIKSEDITVEVAPVREESFKESEWFKHGDFTATLHETLDYKRAWARRDFTVNAIGVEFSGNQTPRLIDPFDGIGDLRSAVLRPCGDDFFRDPVRFLRAIRFKLTLGHQWAQELEDKMGQFNLSGLVPFHFFAEGIKAKNIAFFRHFFDCKELYQVKLSDELKTLEFLRELSGTRQASAEISTLEDILQLIVYGETETSPSQREAFCQIAGVKQSLLKSHEHIAGLLEDLKAMDIDELLKVVSEQSIEEFVSGQQAKTLKEFHQVTTRNAVTLKEKLCPDYYNTYQIWRELLPTTLEGKKQFDELLENKNYPNKWRSYLALYCHLLFKAGS